MIKISDAIRDIIQKDSILHWGLYNRILNLSKLASFLKPLVQIRTKRDVKCSAILMNLSRLQREISKTPAANRKYFIDSLSFHSNLCINTFLNTSEIHEQVNKFYSKVKKEAQNLSITEGKKEITVICNEKFKDDLLSIINEKPKKTFFNVSSIVLEFSEEYSEVPGLLHFILQQTTLQNINVIEISSTYTELIIYIDEKDQKLALDTLLENLKTG
jgi:aspartokinase